VLFAEGEAVASASADQTIRIWNVPRKALSAQLQGNTHEVWSVTWSPDGNDLVSGGRDGSVRYWDPAARPATAVHTVLPIAVRLGGLAFTPDSTAFLTVSQIDGAVVMWNAATYREVRRLAFLGTNHSTVAVSPDGRWLAVDVPAGLVQVWDFNAGRLVTTLGFQETTNLLAQFSAHGNALVCTGLSRGGSVAKLWVVAGWREIRLPEFGPGIVSMDRSLPTNERWRSDTAMALWSGGTSPPASDSAASPATIRAPSITRPSHRTESCSCRQAPRV